MMMFVWLWPVAVAAQLRTLQFDFGVALSAYNFDPDLAQALLVGPVARGTGAQLGAGSNSVYTVAKIGQNNQNDDENVEDVAEDVAANSAVYGGASVRPGGFAARKTHTVSGAQPDSAPLIAVACKTSNLLHLRLRNGVLSTAEDRLGRVDENHQVVFDDTTSETEPLAVGAMSRDAQWLVSDRGTLGALSDLFYQCHLGDSYKLYDAPVHPRCTAVALDVVELVDCD